MSRHASGRALLAIRTHLVALAAGLVWLGPASLAVAGEPATGRDRPDEATPAQPAPSGSAPPASVPSASERPAGADRQERIRELVAAIRAEQARLIELVTEPLPAAQQAPAPGAEPAPRIPAVPLRPEVREVAQRLPALQRQLHELGGDAALLDSPALWQ